MCECGFELVQEPSPQNRQGHFVVVEHPHSLSVAASSLASHT